jgi:hypothetical protein
MTAHIKKFHSTGNRFFGPVQKASVLVFFFLFLLLGLVAGRVEAAESVFGAPADTRDEADEAKADFLFKEPRYFLGFRVGMFYPQANSELFDMVTRELTLEKSDFRSWDLGIKGGFNLFEKVDLVFSFDYFDRSKTSEFRDFVDEQGLPITQTTGFSNSSLTAGIRYLFVPRGRSVGQYAWLPNSIVPFVEAGVGGVWYCFEQSGDFVDNTTLEIFYAHLESSGWAPTAYLGGGADIHIFKSVYVTLDIGYSWAEDELSRSFTGFDPIDLSGLRATAGLSWHY